MKAQPGPVPPAEFVEAAWAGDLDTVKRFVAEGGDVEARHPSTNCGGLVAGTPEVLEWLLERGLDPNADYDPLGWQVWEVRTDCVRSLFAAGATVSAHDQVADESLLHYVTSKPDRQDERLELLEVLLENGADPNTPASDGVPTCCFWRDVKTVGETALHRAAAYSSEAIIRRLIAAGADVCAVDGRGETVRAWASRHWRDLVVIELVSPTV